MAEGRVGSSGFDPLSAPVVEQYDGMFVVRDDLLPGGSKARFARQLFDNTDEICYATPQEGGAQTALALAAKALGKRLTLFVSARGQPHERVRLSRSLGANVVEIKPGYLNNVQHAAQMYASRSRFLLQKKVRYLDFGLQSDQIIEAIAQAARLIPRPTELWFAAGSGTLALAMARAWPNVPRFAVQVGHKLWSYDVGGAKLIIYPKEFSEKADDDTPFPSDPHYDRKAYEIMLQRAQKGATFWNVAGPAESYDDQKKLREKL